MNECAKIHIDRKSLKIVEEVLRAGRGVFYVVGTRFGHALISTYHLDGVKQLRYHGIRIPREHFLRMFGEPPHETEMMRYEFVFKATGVTSP